MLIKLFIGNEIVEIFVMIVVNLVSKCFGIIFCWIEVKDILVILIVIKVIGNKIIKKFCGI